MKLQRSAFIPILLAALACGEGDTPFDPDRQLATCDDPAPLYGSRDERVPDRYAVVFDESASAAVVTARLERTYGFTAEYVYAHALQGFAAELPVATMQAIRCEPEVRFVEHDAWVQLY